MWVTYNKEFLEEDMTEIRIRFPEGRKKALTLSYDDGDSPDARLIEIMKKNGLKGTFNIMSMLFDLPEDHVKERMRIVKEAIFNSDNEVACHSYNHPQIAGMIKTGMIQETLNDRLRLEKEFGRMVRGYAYPYGSHSKEVEEVLEMCGIAYARTVHAHESFVLPQNWYQWNPTCHHNADIMRLADRFLNGDPASAEDPYLFYVWGHTFEFNHDNNWNKIEEFAEKVGNRDDVWYCTNIEFYDYYQCFKGLKFSADESIIYNPSATDVWVSFGGTKEPVKIPAGEIVKRG